MSDHKKEAKAASAAKMQRMGLKLEDGSKSFTDERGGSPFEGLNSGNAGKWPVTPSRFKRGGKVGKSVHAEGDKARKNLGKSARTKKSEGGGFVPLPPRKGDNHYNPYPPKEKEIGDEYAKNHPEEPSGDLNSRSTQARGGVIGRKQAAAMAYKSKGMGMSNKMGIPKMKGMPNLAADTYIPHKKGGAAKHTDEAQDKKLMHKVLKENAFKERAHKVSGGRLGEYIKLASMDAASQGTKRGMDKATQIYSTLPRDPMFPQAERKEKNRLQGIRTAVNKLGGGYGKSGLSGFVPAGKNDEGTDDSNYYEAREKEINRANKSSYPTTSQSGWGQGKKSGGRAEKCWGGETKRSKKFGGGALTGANPMINSQMMANNMRQNMQPMHQPMGQNMGIGSLGGMGQFAQNNPQFAQQLMGALGMGGAAQSDSMGQHMGGYGATPQGYAQQHGMGAPAPFFGGSNPPPSFFGPNGQGGAGQTYNAFQNSQMGSPDNFGAAQSNPMGNMNGAMGAMAGAAGVGRPQRATGGRAKGKTNVNIIISPQSGQQGPMGAGVGMGMPPMPPQMPPMPPQGMPPMPPGGAPQLPPQLMAALAAQGGAGGPPMPRKTGGRVDNRMPKYQEKEFGSGSGRGRLEKIKWPFADGTE